jgi:predicted homoserine dehydrogenase-like protein
VHFAGAPAGAPLAHLLDREVLAAGHGGRDEGDQLGTLGAGGAGVGARAVVHAVLGVAVVAQAQVLLSGARSAIVRAGRSSDWIQHGNQRLARYYRVAQRIE